MCGVRTSLPWYPTSFQPMSSARKTTMWGRGADSAAAWARPATARTARETSEASRAGEANEARRVTAGAAVFVRLPAPTAITSRAQSRSAAALWYKVPLPGPLLEPCFRPKCDLVPVRL